MRPGFGTLCSTQCWIRRGLSSVRWIVLLTILGAVLLVGLAQRLQVSAAIGTFLVGIAVSGPMPERTHRLLAPLRDLFAATFFFFFGLQIDPATLPSALPSAVLLGVVTAVTKVLPVFGLRGEPVLIGDDACGRAWPWSHVVSSQS